jgi:hypothetical protein
MFTVFTCFVKKVQKNFRTVQNKKNVNDMTFTILKGKKDDKKFKRGILNPHQNDQGRKVPCFFQRLIALKCLKCQKIKKNI